MKPADTELRVQKYMAQAGIGSRRQCEDLIRQGRVSVNGYAAELGQKVRPASDIVRLDGEPIGSREKLVYIALHKPRGVISSLRAERGHRTVVDLVDVKAKLYPVGRLDLDSEGLVLLTNDGELAHRLSHPRYRHEKEYRVRMDRQPSQEQLSRWRSGLDLPEVGRTSAARVTPEAGKPGWVRVVMREGKKRQIRVTASFLGLEVRRLIRTRISSLELGALAPGEWRQLSGEEARRLRAEAGLTGWPTSGSGDGELTQ